MNRYGSCPTNVTTTLVAGSKPTRMVCSVASSELCCARKPGAVTSSSIESTVHASGRSASGAANKNTALCSTATSVPSRTDRCSSTPPSAASAPTNTRSCPGSVESTSHKNVNAGSTHRLKNTRVRHSSRTGLREISQATSAGPSVNASVPKAIAVLAANWRGVLASGAGSRATSRSDHNTGPPALSVTGTSQTSAVPQASATASVRVRQRGVAVYTLHSHNGARKTAASARKPLTTPTSTADGYTRRACPRSNSAAAQAMPIEHSASTVQALA